MIKLENLNKSFQAGGKRIDALKDINLEIASGSSIVIFGPSGIGKTTLLSIIGCIEKQTSGRVIIDDVDTSSLKPEELSKLRKEKIGFIFQSFNLLPHLTAKDNIMLPALLDPGLDKKMAGVYDFAKEIGMKERLDHLPGELSAGEQQRVAIMRSVINSPQIILADEPTADLDKENSLKIINILKELNRKKNCTVVIATNDDQVASNFPNIFHLK